MKLVEIREKVLKQLETVFWRTAADMWKDEMNEEVPPQALMDRYNGLERREFDVSVEEEDEQPNQGGLADHKGDDAPAAEEQPAATMDRYHSLETRKFDVSVEEEDEQPNQGGLAEPQT
jgi:hypothetical protein